MLTEDQKLRRKETAHRRYLRNREQILQKHKARYDREKYLILEKQRAYQKANREKLLAKQKKYYRKFKYGLTDEQFEELHALAEYLRERTNS